MKVFHYTHLRRWNTIKSKGLTPYIPTCFPWGTNIEPAVYALFSPEPEDWVRNKYFPGIWEELLDYLKDGILVEVEVDVGDKRALVADFSFMAGYMERRNNQVSEGVKCESYKGAIQSYWKSLIPIREYLNDGFSFKLPEVLLLDEVGRERFTVSGQQPVLEHHISSGKAEDYTLWCITQTPGLTPWRREYETRHGSLEAMFMRCLGAERL